MAHVPPAQDPSSVEGASLTVLIITRLPSDLFIRVNAEVPAPYARRALRKAIDLGDKAGQLTPSRAMSSSSKVGARVGSRGGRLIVPMSSAWPRTEAAMVASRSASMSANIVRLWRL